MGKKKINPKAELNPQQKVVINVNGNEVPNFSGEVTNLDSQNLVIGRNSFLKLDDINTSIKDAPPLQRDRVQGSYVGVRVDWDVEFSGGEFNGETIRLHLIVPEAKLHPRSVWCNVSASEYPEFGVLKEGARLRLSGKIEKVSSAGVYISDANLNINDMQRGI